MDNYWQGLWDQEVPKGGLKVASISLALNSPWKIKATKDHFGRIGFQLIADNLDISDDIFKRDLLKTSQLSVLFIDKTTLYIRLEDSDSLEIFNEYAESIITKASQALSEKQMLEIAISQSLKWFNFLKPTYERKLKPFQQQGLIAELLFLKKLINKIGLSNALNAWFGPDKYDKDFIMGGIGIEVKAKQSGRIKVTISSETQLDFQGLDNLILAVFTINSSTSNDENSFTLDSIIDELGKLFDKELNLKYLFDKKIAEVGYDYDDDYSDKFWNNLENPQLFKLNDSFPAVTSENINVKSISNVSYDIDLNTVKEFKVDEEELNKFL